MSELAILEIALNTDEDTKLSQLAGSCMHGLLMEHIDSDYASYLHEQALRPYSQSLYYDKERKLWLWRLAALSEEAINEILEPMFSLPATVQLKQRNCLLHLVDKNYLFQKSYAELEEEYFAHTAHGRGVEINFISPCSFKSDGSYMIFPQPKLITKSLLCKWNSFTKASVLDEQQIAYNLAEQLYVADYKLQMHKFALEGVRIPAFCGKYTLGFKGNVMSQRIVCMLGEFANYSGIGIKTALGMGAVKIIIRSW